MSPEQLAQIIVNALCTAAMSAACAGVYAATIDASGFVPGCCVAFMALSVKSAIRDFRRQHKAKGRSAIN